MQQVILQTARVQVCKFVSLYVWGVGACATAVRGGRVRWALLLDRARVRVVPEPSAEALVQASAVTVTTPLRGS